MKCNAREKAYRRMVYRLNRETGLCHRCGGENSTPDFSRCLPCRKIEADKQHARTVAKRAA